jgi:hypothetical protein
VVVIQRAETRTPTTTTKKKRKMAVVTGDDGPPLLHRRASGTAAAAAVAIARLAALDLPSTSAFPPSAIRGARERYL